MTTVEYSDSLKKSLEEFSKQENKTITPELNGIIENISTTGITCYPWNILKELFYFKLSQILDIFEKDYLGEQSNINNLPNSPQSSPSSSSSSSSLSSPNHVNSKDEEMAKIKNQVNISGLIKMKKEFLQNFKESKAAPFTIQRLCELILNYQMYKSFSKYLCAVEKMLNVSTLPHLTPEEVLEYNKNKLSSNTSRSTTTTTSSSISGDNDNDNNNNNDNNKNKNNTDGLPSLEGYAFSSSFTTSFPSTTTTTTTTDTEMKDIDDEEEEEEDKSKK